MARIKLIEPRVQTVRSEIAGAPAKVEDPFYYSAAYAQWREDIVARAGRRCEWVEDGQRCERAEPAHRMFADHVIERRDGGAPFDRANGQCLCYQHHTIKTMQERKARAARQAGLLLGAP